MCEWMAWTPGTYNEEIVWEFYASYAATIRGSILRRAKPAIRPPLDSTLVRGFPVNISKVILHRFIYGPEHTLPINTSEFDYQMGIIQSREF
ncbi:hypothetical protein R3W88_008112 [Solanum pinnatisectum]|uniref:Uncharacterized protein n=1 Tax=Solanum pinnatisectum TaxID=50273 RepID=A0AAV9M7C4_9SOLN|nr:hypothetical protein R3W88_008112 [Solanum pinnatisectum]